MKILKKIILYILEALFGFWADSGLDDEEEELN